MSLNSHVYFLAPPVLATVLASVLGMGCARKSPPPENAEPPVVHNPEPPAAPGPTKPMVPARTQREVLVGGCLNDCDDPKEALDNFLKAAVSGDLDRTRSFVNSAILVHNQERHGERWAEWFLEGRTGERRAEIDKWLKGWMSWVDRILDPTDRTRPALGVKVVEQNQRRYVVDYRPPELKPDPNGRPMSPAWRIVLKPRGLEWLVAEIDDQRRP